jgi:hypothetical protein
MPSLQTNAPPPIDWSRKAIASVVLGVVGAATIWLVIGLLAAALGAVLGHMARHETSAGGLRGRRFAALGLIFSYSAMLLFPLFALAAAASLPAFVLWRDGAGTVGTGPSEAKAARLFVACEAYARANRDRYPGEWEELSGRYLPPRELGDLLRSPHRGGAAVAFGLVPHDRPVLPALAESIVVIEELAPASVPEIAVIYANGTVTTLHNPNYEAP